MKKNLILLTVLIFLGGSYAGAQNTRLLKAADKSFSDGKKDYNKKRYKEAAPSLEIVIENINVTDVSRKYLIMRFEANVMLIDIYFDKLNNLRDGCVALTNFVDDINAVKSTGIFKAKDIYKYLELEKDYAIYITQCENFESIEKDKSDFEKIFDEEFDD
ncbi:MAG: hypothetical protein PHW82_07335 [Bacteroidales bacterium]|nr:hypothetical protein [Bacteroidales bacterium]